VVLVPQVVLGPKALEPQVVLVPVPEYTFPQKVYVVQNGVAQNETQAGLASLPSSPSNIYSGPSVSGFFVSMNLFVR
jgi:hypothetical protein